MADGHIWSDAQMALRPSVGSTIGMADIKLRRRTQFNLKSHPDLFVGQCAPFYFCPRSVMLYIIHKGNHSNLAYRGGQESILHLRVDLHAAIAWANENNRRWAFTLSNAGAFHFEDRADTKHLSEIDWEAVEARTWGGAHKEGKQAEFLIETSLAWSMVEHIGVMTKEVGQQVARLIATAPHRPPVSIEGSWYY